jgi:hypothetical protein
LKAVVPVRTRRREHRIPGSLGEVVDNALSIDTRRRARRTLAGLRTPERAPIAVFAQSRRHLKKPTSCPA